MLLGAAPAALLADTPTDTLVVASAIDDIVSLDPAKAHEFSGLDMVNNTYDGLVEINPTTLAQEPGLAESWSVVDDGVTYTFKMKAGLTFASGNPVTADAAAWSLQRAVKPNEGMVLEARPGQWRGDAKIRNVFIQHGPEAATERLQLEKGDIDVARSLSPTDVEGMAGNADVKIQNDVRGKFDSLAFNQKNENTKNAKFLHAMRWAVDCQGMAETIMTGAVIPHQAFLPQGYPGALDDLPYALDIDKAKALLAESGIKDPKVVLSVRNAADRMDVAQSIQNTFGRAGITVELKVGEGADGLKEYRARLHDAALQTWLPDYPNPNTNSSTFAENPDNSDAANHTGYLAWRNAMTQAR